MRKIPLVSVSLPQVADDSKQPVQKGNLWEEVGTKQLAEVCVM